MGGFLSMLFSPSSKYDIGKIERGFTKDQVRRIFGEPESVTQGGLVEEQWIYTVPFRIYTSIHFDADGKVTSTYRSGESVRS